MDTKTRNKLWCQANPEKRRVNQKRYISTAKGQYYRLKESAKRHNRSFELTLTEFVNWRNNQPLICHYCGAIVRPTGRNGDCFTVDRRDNAGAYNLKNIVVACLSCNTIKGNYENKERYTNKSLSATLKRAGKGV